MEFQEIFTLISNQKYLSLKHYYAILVTSCAVFSHILEYSPYSFQFLITVCIFILVKAIAYEVLTLLSFMFLNYIEDGKCLIFPSPVELGIIHVYAIFVIRILHINSLGMIVKLEESLQLPVLCEIFYLFVRWSLYIVNQFLRALYDGTQDPPIRNLNPAPHSTDSILNQEGEFLSVRTQGLHRVPETTPLVSATGSTDQEDRGISSTLPSPSLVPVTNDTLLRNQAEQPPSNLPVFTHRSTQTTARSTQTTARSTQRTAAISNTSRLTPYESRTRSGTVYSSSFLRRN